MKKVQAISELRLALRKLRRHKLAWIGGMILLILYVGAVFADFIAPYPYDSTSRKKSYHPPTKLHFVDEEGKLSLRPFVYNYKLEFDPQTYRKIYTPDESKKFYIKLFVNGEKHRILGLFGTSMHLFGVDRPARIYLFGSDLHGRDIFSRILYGGRISLTVGIAGILISFTIGMIVGGISGFFGGKVDNLLMRMAEMMMMVPGLYLMLALRAAFPPSMSPAKVYFMVVIVLSFIGWAGLSRVIRGMVLSIRKREYVEAAVALGISNFRIITKHILPNTLSYAIVAATLGIPGYILGESALSLLSLGIAEPQASWGNMLSVALDYKVISLHPWILMPGIFIFLAVMAFNFFGDGLRDAFDPKMKVMGKW